MGFLGYGSGKDATIFFIAPISAKTSPVCRNL
jgi:hypothetical protein